MVTCGKKVWPPGVTGGAGTLLAGLLSVLGMAQRRRKGSERKIAHERIDILFGLAEREASRGNQTRANRYAGLAAKIGMRYNVHLPRQYKRRYCRKCHAFLVPGKNCRIRVARGKVTMTCGVCGDVRRFPYVRERAARRAGAQ